MEHVTFTLYGSTKVMRQHLSDVVALVVKLRHMHTTCLMKCAAEFGYEGDTISRLEAQDMSL
ncbi:unnamed protein product [Rhodiola kirilowii]